MLWTACTRAVDHPHAFGGPPALAQWTACTRAVDHPPALDGPPARPRWTARTRAVDRLQALDGPPARPRWSTCTRTMQCLQTRVDGADPCPPPSSPLNYRRERPKAGVYVKTENGEGLRFLRMPRPSEDDVYEVAMRTAKKVAAYFAKKVPSDKESNGEVLPAALLDIRSKSRGPYLCPSVHPSFASNVPVRSTSATAACVRPS